MDKLLSERRETEHLTAQLREGAAPEGHFGIIERWSGGLGGETGKLDGHRFLHERAVVVEPDSGRGVQGAEGINAVEHEVGATVPEIVEVENRVDIGRRVAGRYPAHVEAASLEDLVGNGGAVIDRRTWNDAHKLGEFDPLRTYDVVGVADDL